MVYADLLIWNGTVITLDPQDSVAEALAVKDGKVLATGSEEQVSHLIGPETRVMDMGGGTATPGLISTHDHFLQHGVSAQHILDIRYPKARSCQDIARMSADRASETERGKLIIATGWDETLLKERRSPTDKTSTTHPQRTPCGSGGSLRWMRLRNALSSSLTACGLCRTPAHIGVV